MVKKVIEMFACDICGEDGERTTHNFPDGILTLDRCAAHDGVLRELRKEKGSWGPESPARITPFRVSSLEDIERQRVHVE